MKELVVIGFLEVFSTAAKVKSAGKNGGQVFHSPDSRSCPISRIELICDPKFRDLARICAQDIRSLSPNTEVRIAELGFSDAWDLEEVYGGLYDYARQYPFDLDSEELLDSHYNRYAYSSDFTVSSYRISIPPRQAPSVITASFRE